MTRYERGFMNKCAEYGVDGLFMLKYAASASGLGFNVGAGSLGGIKGGYATGHGMNTAGFGSRNGGISVSLSDAAINNGLLGAGIGAVSGITREALRDDNERKHYLKSLLRGILYGGGIGLASTVIGGIPDIVGKLKNR